MKKIVKKNYKILIGIVMGIFVSTAVTYGAENILTGSDVSYNNALSHGSKNNIQGAIDELYEKAKPCKVSKGTGTARGDEINCGTENFYVVNSSNDYVTMFSKYNLDIGDNLSSSYEFYNTDNTGIQNGTCTGSEGYYNGQKYIFTCIMHENCCSIFSTTDIINKYKNYLIDTVKLDKQKTSVSVPDYNFLKNIGCTINYDDYTYTGNCISSNLSWIYSTSYYFIPEQQLNFAYRMWVDVSGEIRYMSSPWGGFGIRPIVVISKNDINY